jgi:hypothetical protein
LSGRPGLRAGTLALLCLLAVAAAPVLGAPKVGQWVELDKGSEGKNFFWSIKAKLGEGTTGRGSLGAQRPCLLVATTWRTGRLEYQRSKFRQCASASPLRRAGPPLIASGMQPSSGAARQFSAVGMIFALAARRVRLTLSGGRTKTIRLRDLDPAQRRAAGLGRLRYAAFAIRGEWCAERLVSLGAGGKILWDSAVDDYACGSEGEPHFAARGARSR